MATYKQIQEYIKHKYGKSVKTCHIAHMKHEYGFVMRKAPNRISVDSRVYECPDNFKPLITDAMRHFKMIE